LWCNADFRRRRRITSTASARLLPDISSTR
jgi:hypothetical protein